MLNRETVLTLLKTKLNIPDSNVAISALQGDASNRSYYRLHYTNENRPATMILMELAEPEAFKKSEEQVSTSTIAVNELPYINILSHLTHANVAVPKLYFYDPDNGLLFLEDLGDQTLEMELKDCGEDAARWGLHFSLQPANCRLSDGHEQLVLLHTLPGFTADALHNTVTRGFQLVFHLHRFKNHDGLTSLDRFAFGHRQRDNQSGHGRTDGNLAGFWCIFTAPRSQ